MADINTAPRPATTDRIRDMFTNAYAWRATDDIPGGDTNLTNLRTINATEFDTWLKQHDTETEAKALAAAATAHFEASIAAGLGEPTAVAEWLRARAKAVSPSAESVATVKQRDDAEGLRRAIGGVLFNVRNFPVPAQSRLLGQDMAPLNGKLTEAVLAAGYHRTPVQANQWRFRMPGGDWEGPYGAPWFLVAPENAEWESRAVTDWGSCLAPADPTSCESCAECIHNGNKCCGCYDGACCKPDDHRPAINPKDPTDG